MELKQSILFISLTHMNDANLDHRSELTGVLANRPATMDGQRLSSQELMAEDYSILSPSRT